jgi:adenosylcobyric acid synthase
MKAKTLMVQGTSSSVGKSLLVAGFCHLLARRGVRVAPYKAQNMSNNAAVCPDGAEIGRAQAVQALAAGLEPHVDMNPVLIKPEADSRSQVIVMGRPWKTLEARDYYPQKDVLWREVTHALDRLREQYELVIIEGAGSAAELNLKESDIVNMAVARYARSPVLLAGDIDRGGIFAQLLGTLWLLDPEERELVKGLIVNKFRGDISLFIDGVHILKERGGVPVLGVVPYLHNLTIPEEDAVALEDPFSAIPHSSGNTEIVVIHLPRIANFDDFDRLETQPGVRLRYTQKPAHVGKPAAIIIPGTKSTINDLTWLRTQGLDEIIRQHAQSGGAVVGICGGYQMLGQIISDPNHVESKIEQIDGLGLLPIETVFSGDKATHQASAQIRSGAGWLANLAGQTVRGYEIHMGRTKSPSAWLEITELSGQSVNVLDGAVSKNGRVWGCYVHGLFENNHLRKAWLEDLGWVETEGEQVNPFGASLTRLADTLEASLDMELLEEIIWED